MKQHKPLTREQLLKRGRCCHHGCKNCPWKKEKCEEPRILYIDYGETLYSEDNIK